MSRTLLLFVSVFTPTPLFAEEKKSNDGRIILMRSTKDGLFAKTTYADVISVDVATGNLTKLNTKSFRSDFGCPMSLSPDGKRAVFQAWSIEGSTDHNYHVIVHLYDPKTKPRTFPIHGDALSWTPEGKSFVIAEDAEWRKAHHLVDAETLKSKEFDLPRVEKPADPKSRWGHMVMDLSPDGAHWLTRRSNGDDRETTDGVYIVDRKSLEVRQLPIKSAVRLARFSPDGKTILYLDPDDTLQTMPVAGEKATLVPTPEGKVISMSGFCWSPDSKRVAYIALFDTKKGEFESLEVRLIASDLDGKNRRVILRITNPIAESFYSPHWRK